MRRGCSLLCREDFREEEAFAKSLPPWVQLEGVDEEGKSGLGGRGWECLGSPPILHRAGDPRISGLPLGARTLASLPDSHVGQEAGSCSTWHMEDSHLAGWGWRSSACPSGLPEHVHAPQCRPRAGAKAPAACAREAGWAGSGDAGGAGAGGRQAPAGAGVGEEQAREWLRVLPAPQVVLLRNRLAGLLDGFVKPEPKDLMGLMEILGDILHRLGTQGIGPASLKMAQHLLPLFEDVRAGAAAQPMRAAEAAPQPMRAAEAALPANRNS